MNIFDNIDENSNEIELIDIKKSKVHNISIFENMTPGDAVRYNYKLNRFVLSSSSIDSVFIGWYLGYDSINDLVYVMYKGFLSKDIINIPISIKDVNVNSYIVKTFDMFKGAIKDKMPRIKRLKRINLRMMTKELTLLLYNNFNHFVETYALAFNDNNSKMLKASIVTTPFYIIDNDKLKLYHFSSNEMTKPDIESEGNFLAFFCYKFQK